MNLKHLVYCLTHSKSWPNGNRINRNNNFRLFLSKSGIMLAIQICILTLQGFYCYNCEKTDLYSQELKKKKYKIPNNALLFRLKFKWRSILSAFCTCFGGFVVLSFGDWPPGIRTSTWQATSQRPEDLITAPVSHQHHWKLHGLDKLLLLSGPQFPHPLNGDHTSAPVSRWLWWLPEIIHVKHRTWCLVSAQ